MNKNFLLLSVSTLALATMACSVDTNSTKNNVILAEDTVSIQDSITNDNDRIDKNTE